MLRTVDLYGSSEPSVIDEIRSSPFERVQGAAQSRPRTQPPTTISLRDWKGLTGKLSQLPGLAQYPHYQQRFKRLSTPFKRYQAHEIPFGNHLLATEHVIEGLWLATELLKSDGDTEPGSAPTVIALSDSSLAATTDEESTGTGLDPATRDRLTAYQSTCLQKLVKIDPARLGASKDALWIQCLDEQLTCVQAMDRIHRHTYSSAVHARLLQRQAQGETTRDSDPTLVLATTVEVYQEAHQTLTKCCANSSARESFERVSQSVLEALRQKQLDADVQKNIASLISHLQGPYRRLYDSVLTSRTSLVQCSSPTKDTCLKPEVEAVHELLDKCELHDADTSYKALYQRAKTDFVAYTMMIHWVGHRGPILQKLSKDLEEADEVIRKPDAPTQREVFARHCSRMSRISRFWQDLHSTQSQPHDQLEGHVTAEADSSAA